MIPVHWLDLLLLAGTAFAAGFAGGELHSWLRSHDVYVRAGEDAEREE